MTDLNSLFDAAIEAGKSRDEIIISLVTESGLSIAAATKKYAAYAKERGLTSTVVSRKADALDWLADRYDADTWIPSAVTAAVLDIQDVFSVAESTARDYCKEFSKQLGCIHPTTNPREAMFSWLAKHDDMEDKAIMKTEFKDFCKQLGRSDSNINEYWKGYELHLFIKGQA